MSVEQLVLELADPGTRENALLDLSKKREAFPELAPYLWHSFGTIAALLQEVVSIYPLLSPPALTAHASNRVCNALALLQCVASHPDTRALFLQGKNTRVGGEWAQRRRGERRASDSAATRRALRCQCKGSRDKSALAATGRGVGLARLARLWRGAR